MSAPAPRPVSDVLSSPVTPSAQSRHRLDIEGLRAVAALLIAVYHIWFGTVSGGVDVFLLLTGFLATGSLVRTLERGDRVEFGAYWSKVLRRLSPAGAVVLGAVLLGTYLFIPRSRWTEILSEVQASLLYYGNWNLAFGSVDYMAENSAAGPVQHFWSLAIQGQFYLVWPLFITAVGMVAAWLGMRIRTAALGSVALVAAGSFVYSVWITANEPVWAYFDSGARLWELALGGLLALSVPYLNLPGWLRGAAGWLGLAALVTCGAVISDTLDYPGYASLWPTAAAALVILAGAGENGNGRFTANRLLSMRPLPWLGGRAFPLFLWHWPVLVFYLEVTDRVRPSFTGGLMILAVSFVAAVATTWAVDGGVTRVTTRYKAPIWSLAAGVLFIVPVLVATSLWGQEIDRNRDLRLELSSNPMNYPGAAVHLDQELATELPVLPVHPDTSTVAEDTIARTDECNAVAEDEEMVLCEFGDPDADFTIALVGSSHVRHWFDAMKTITERQGWNMVMMTRNACQFSPEVQYRAGKEYPNCTAWNQQVMTELGSRDIDAVFGLASLTDSSEDGEEHVPDGFVQRWYQLDEMGIDMIAVRDTPRFDYDVPECVAQEGAAECVADQRDSMAETAPYQDLAEVPDNTSFVDLTGYLCQDGTCQGVIGNQLVYYDKHHLSYAFSESMAAALEPHLLEASGQENRGEAGPLSSSAAAEVSEHS
ncbi:acyltransferase family protein [Nocardiopsis xinjiangensis]|uniref:acyltransferase family protein n=1 Tax=Nocardiopsis xinjiangensis TaxID=124285 RepID=UPI00034B92F6|nr:acyltransferase family protein [Nocardiopsis xinjiangensis]